MYICGGTKTKEMENQFVPYELAVKLKELGFDEPCLYYFSKQENNQLWQDLDSGYYRNSTVSKSNLLWGDTYDNGNVSAPLWQQAFDWFRYQYSLHTEIRSYTAERFTLVIQELKNTVNYIEYGGINNTFKIYQEARQVCLEKLIEIVENKNLK